MEKKVEKKEMDSAENKPPILHILVVGFHHKLGCQVRNKWWYAVKVENDDFFLNKFVGGIFLSPLGEGYKWQE